MSRTAVRRTGPISGPHPSGCGPPRARATSEGQTVFPAPRSATSLSIVASISPSRSTRQSSISTAARASEANWRRHITRSTAAVAAMNAHGPANQPR